MTLTDVRAMSMSSSIPRMARIGHSGRPKEAAVPEQDHEGRPGHAGDALAGQHEGEDDQELLPEAQVDARGLGHEDRGQGEVERRCRRG